ncbi:MAG: alpha/beta hydrolase [Deltaproteobacteria bacterium]|nr:alpha/beta hydrolase [Deltaproteobacteria bacterium]
MSAVVYKGFTQEEMEFQFNPQVSAPDYPRWAEERKKASLRAREALKSYLDVSYGSSPRQVMDIFPAAKSGAPVLAYIHGGYWRGGSKEENCHFAELCVKRGATVAVLEHDLCPSVTVTEIVRQIRSAIVWIHGNIAKYGGNPSRLYLAGSSAGGHLVAMALAHDWQKEALPRQLIKGATAISGVYDLDAVLHVSVNNEIRLEEDSARENSPFLHPPLPYSPLIIAVGGDETRGWKQMSEDFFTLCKKRGVECEYLEVPGAHHFSLSAHLADPNSPLARAILRQTSL